jgi:hypothetical protein
VSVQQVQIRGDAGLIAAILKKPDDARRYLTYSGAGHLKDHDWLRAVDSDLPVCDDEVRPDDFAVVEFGIGSQGKAVGAIPVYASRRGNVGMTFARAVSEWQWDKALVDQMGYVWRASVRLELRCAKRPPPLGLADAFNKPSEAWLHANAVTLPSQFDRKRVDALPATGARSIFLRAVELDKASGAAETAIAYDRLVASIADAGAPPEMLPFLLNRSGRTGGFSIRSQSAIRAARLARVIPLLEKSDRMGRGLAWLRTEMAIALETNGAFDAAKTQLDAVLAQPASILTDDDPIRSIAILHRALIDQHQGNAADAARRLDAAGLGAEQCSLLDVRPVPQRGQISSNDFPTEAIRWGFEGNVTTAFDIAADGSVTDVRTVIAYPPFVFSNAAVKSFARFKYLAPKIGNEAVGCIGQSIRINYRMPR